jgi:hypothetical protein
MINAFKTLGWVDVRKRTANGLKIASQYTLIRGKCRMRVVYPSMGKPRKPGLPRIEELSEESTEGTARKGEKTFVSPSEEKSQNTHGNEEDTIIHPVTGEPFNPRTGEYYF